jgi:serine/threonine protein kinase
MEGTKQTITIETPNKSSANFPKLINQGTYGCVFRPAFLCDGNTLKEDEYITKVQARDITSQKEEEIGNQLKSTSNANEYFAGIVKTCPIDLSKIEDNEVKKCDFIEKQAMGETPQEEYIASTIKYVGKEDIIDYFLSRIDKPQQYVMSLFHMHFHLLTALCHLQTANIVHYDLKSNNVMIHDVKKTPVIIDFGISFAAETKPDTLDNANPFYVYGADYSPWCMDIHIINYMWHKLKSESPLQESIKEEHIQEIVTDYMDTNSSMEMLTNTERTVMKTSWNEYLSSFVGKEWDSLYNELWNARWSWDNYSIALMMLKYTRGAFKVRENEFNQHYVALLKKIIKATPDSRFDAQQAKEELLQVMKMSKQEKYELIESAKEKMLKDRRHNMLTHKKESLLETRHAL